MEQHCPRQPPASPIVLTGLAMQPPKTVEAFDKTLKRLQGGTHVAYFVCTEGGALAGVIDISEIVRGVPPLISWTE